jgi:hypothetical protein
LNLAALLYELQQQAAEALHQAATLPAEVSFHFDAAQEDPGTGGWSAPGVACGGVQKTVRRTVVSLRQGQFRACETVRHAVGHGGPASGRSRPLAAVVAPGSRYAFDLIAPIGVETYLRGRGLQEVHAELAHHVSRHCWTCAITDRAPCCMKI